MSKYKKLENIISEEYQEILKEDLDILNFLPQKGIENKLHKDYIEHYTKDAHVFDYFKEEFGADTLEDFRRLRQYILTLIPNNAEWILDVGSGGAWLAGEMTSKNRNIISFDISDLNVQKAVKTIPSEYHYGIVGDALQAPFNENSLDCIVSSEVIEHVPDPGAFVNSLLKILKSGGKLIISTPYKEKIRYEVCIHCNEPTPRSAHLHSFNESVMQKLAKENIQNFEYHTFGNKAMVILQTHKITKYLSFGMWKFIDKIANTLLKKQGHIIAVYTK